MARVKCERNISTQVPLVLLRKFPPEHSFTVLHWFLGDELPASFLATGDQDMKRTVFAGVTALALLTAGQVLADSVTLQIAPEQRTRIKEYVVKEKVKPV